MTGVEGMQSAQEELEEFGNFFSQISDDVEAALKPIANNLARMFSDNDTIG